MGVWGQLPQTPTHFIKEVHMADTLRLLCITAHPDDESLGMGGALAKYAAEGIATYLLTATRGERGWAGAAHAYPGLAALGSMRERELREAAAILGLRRVDFLGYTDGDLDLANAEEVIAGIVAHLRRVRPHVVITFGPDGSTGHPDHIAISQFTTAALVCAADSEYTPRCDWPPHRVAKLYYLAGTQARIAAYDAVFGDSAMTVGGVKRSVLGWAHWAITTRIDTVDYWSQVWQAIARHRSQLPNYEALVRLPEERHRELWGAQEFYRAFSLVNGGHTIEHDLFAGLR
jgi:LmbE family N-acetylglucosaminyl deacetylase